MAKILDTLSEEQIARFGEFRDKWTEFGLSTKPANRIAAEEGIIEMYQIAKLPPPQRIVWCLSPIGIALTRAMVINIGDIIIGVGNSVRNSVRTSVCNSVRNSIGDSVEDSVGNSVWDSVWDNVRDSVRDSVWDSVWTSVMASVMDSILDSVRDSVKASIRASIRASVWDSVWGSGFGQHDAAWLAVYDYFATVCGLIKQTEKLRGLWSVAKNAGWYLPYEHICWISERHNICRLKDNRIHCSDGPAIAYSDGWAIYGLNGVRVPQWLVETPANRIDPKKFAEIENAEVRREFVRKVGVERIAQKCGATLLDKRDDYELLQIDLQGSTGKWPYLKMLNPSIGVWHLECVDKACRTVQQALNFRASQLKNLTVDWKPEVLT